MTFYMSQFREDSSLTHMHALRTEDSTKRLGDLLRGFVSLMVEDSMRIITSLMLENSFTGLTTKF